jgi:hypothetical protein
MKITVKTQEEAVDVSRTLVKICNDLRLSHIDPVIQCAYEQFLCNIRDAIKIEKNFYTPEEWEKETGSPLPDTAPVFCRGVKGNSFIDLASTWDLLLYLETWSADYGQIIYSAIPDIPPLDLEILKEDRYDE